MSRLFRFIIGVVVYHLAGFPLLLSLLRRFRKRQRRTANIDENDLPRVTVLCPAYNEAECIERKIRNFQALDYPPERIELIVISDDSTDGTNEIVQRFAGGNIRLVVQKPRRGKPSGHNLVERQLDTDIVVSTDANSMYKPDAIRRMVDIFRKYPDVGMVSGRLRLISPRGGDSGEGAYWRFENWLKQLQSDVGSLTCANGAIFGIRRHLFVQVDAASTDDFERTLQTLEAGYSVYYEPQAIAEEPSLSKSSSELSRKMRIVSREWPVLMRHRSLLHPVRFPLVSLFLASTKLIRWLLFVWAGGLLLSSLGMSGKSRFARCFSFIQITGYILGFLQLRLEKSGRGLRLLKPFAYGTGMIWVSLAGFLRYLRGDVRSTWQSRGD